VLACGVAGIAVISVLAGSDAPTAATRRLVEHPAWPDPGSRS